MYTIKAFENGEEYVLHNPRVEELFLGDAYYEEGDNLNGQAEFTVYPDHPFYENVKKLTTEIVFYKDGVEKFRGRVLYDDEDSKGAKKVFVEGQLAYFVDSIQRPKVYHNYTVKQYLTDLIASHNSQVEERKQYVLGTVSVTDSNDSLYRYSNWKTTRNILKDKLSDRLGGHFRVRWRDGLRVLDYLNDSDFHVQCSQTIRFGKNLLSFSKNMSAADLCTCPIPLGARQAESSIEGLEERLTIKSVNGGVDYVTDDNAVREYGKIFKTVTFDDVTVASNLKKKGEEYLRSTQFEKMVLELKAIDMNLTDEDIEEFQIGQMIHCISEPNGLDSWFPLTKKRIYIAQFKKNTVTLGDATSKASYTSSNSQKTAQIEEAINTLPSKKEILQEALRDATDLMNDMTQSGNAIHTKNEFIVADQPGVENAVRLWRWGLGGLGYYKEGYDGPLDGVALTMDGKINGKMLLVNSVVAESIDIGYRTEVETTIKESETAAKDYADGEVRTARETIENSITNVENQIKAEVHSVKQTVARKNYVVGGEQETLSLSNFSVSGTAAAMSKVEYLNLDCFKAKFNASGTTTLTQNLGELPAGDYTIVVEFAFPSTALRPNYIQYGFSGNLTTAYLSGYTSGEFHSLSKKLHITKATKSIEVRLNSSYASREMYITNIRVLRDFQELLDDVDTRITVEVGAITQQVAEVYESNSHNYIKNGNFSNMDNWNVSNASYVYKTTVNNTNCARVRYYGGTKYYMYQSLGTLKPGKFIVRFRAATYSGQVSTARVQLSAFGSYKYTIAGELTTSFKTFEFEYDNTYSGSKTIYFYPYVAGTDILITGVEVIGSISSFAESQLKVTADAITAEVTRATNNEKTLKSSITANATAITTKVTAAQVESTITQKADSIRLKASKISWSSTYSKMTESGILTCGTYPYLKLDNGKIKGGWGSTEYGYIDYSASARNVDTGTTYNGLQVKAGCMRISVHELSTRKTTNVSTIAYIGATGTFNYISRIEPYGNGGVQWWESSVHFENGLMTSSL